MTADVISIRDTRTEDLEALRRINAESAPDVSLLEADTMQSSLRPRRWHGSPWHEAQSVGYLVGFAHPAAYDGEEFLWVKSRYQDFVFVDQVAVAARCRGLGVGTALYAGA